MELLFPMISLLISWKGKKANINEKDAGFVPSERNSNFFSPSKLCFCTLSLSSASLGGEVECDLYVSLPMELSVCARFLFPQKKLLFCTSCYLSHNSVWKQFSEVNVVESKDQEMCWYFLWQVLWLHKFAACFRRFIVMQNLQTGLIRLVEDPPVQAAPHRFTSEPYTAMSHLHGWACGVGCEV